MSNQLRDANANVSFTEVAKYYFTCIKIPINGDMEEQNTIIPQATDTEAQYRAAHCEWE